MLLLKVIIQKQVPVYYIALTELTRRHIALPRSQKATIALTIPQLKYVSTVQVVVPIMPTLSVQS